MYLKPAALALLASIPLAAFAQAPDRPGMPAAKVDTAPALDGDVLGDPVWQTIDPQTEFIQNTPDDGLPVSQKTELRLA